MKFLIDELLVFIMKNHFKLTGYTQLRPLWLAIFSDILGFSLLITVLPSLTQEFGVTPLMINLISATNGLFSFIAAPIWGYLSDRFGRKPMLLLSQMGTILGFILLGISTNLWMIGISRVVDGLFGGNFPISKAVINDVVEPKNMARELTTFGVAHNVANLFGPALGGIMFSNFGLLGPGIVAAGLAAISFGSTWLFLDETAPIKIKDKSHQTITIDEKNGITEQNHLNDQNQQNHSKQPPERNDHLIKWHQNRPLIYALVIFGFQTFAFGILISNFAMYGLLKFNLNAQAMGFFLTIGAIFQIIIRYSIYVPLLHKWGEYKMAVVGFIIYLIELAFFVGISQKWHFLVLLIANSFATSGTRGGLSSFVSNLVNQWERGKVQGIMSSLDTFSQIIGPLLGGMMLTYFQPRWFTTIPWVFMGIAFIILITASPLHQALHDRNVKMSKKFQLIHSKNPIER